MGIETGREIRWPLIGVHGHEQGFPTVGGSFLELEGVGAMGQETPGQRGRGLFVHGIDGNEEPFVVEVLAELFNTLRRHDAFITGDGYEGQDITGSNR